MANVWGESIRLNELPEGAEVVSFGHRSGAETHQACPRRYFFNYEYLGRGIGAFPTPVHFKVGSAVHLGFAALLLDEGIESAIKQALDYLRSGRVFETLSDDQKTEQLVLVEGLLYAFYVYAFPSLMRDFEVLCVETGAIEYIPLPCIHGWIPNLCKECHCDESNQPRQFVAIQSRPDAILRNRKTHEVCVVNLKTIDDPTDLRKSQ